MIMNVTSEICVPWGKEWLTHLASTSQDLLNRPEGKVRYYSDFSLLMAPSSVTTPTDGELKYWMGNWGTRSASYYLSMADL